MVDNVYTTKQIKGVFGKLTDFFQKSREAKKEEKRIDFQEAKQYQKESAKVFNQNHVDEARQYQKDKALEVINSNAPLAHKLKAINELHKEHKPKLNPIIQDISDRAYINRFNRDKRFERTNMLKDVLADHKQRQISERQERMNRIQERNNKIKCDRDARLLIQEAKQGLRRIR